MNFIKNIRLNVEIKGKNLIVHDGTTLQIVMGSTAANANLHYYNIRKKGHVWFIPIGVLMGRVKQLHQQKIRLEERLDIMEQILRQVKK